MAATRVLVVAEETLARAGLAALLRARAELDIIGQVAALTAAEIDRYDPHVIVFDLGWDADAAVGVLADIVEAGVPVLALVPVDEAASMAWRAGARGILLRNAAPEAVETAIAGLMAGMAIIDLALAESYPLLGNPHRGESIEPLTPRELEVLQLVAEGLSNRAIALQLDISEHTVKFHINALMGKLEAQSRTQAVVRAARLGLIRL